MVEAMQADRQFYAAIFMKVGNFVGVELNHFYDHHLHLLSSFCVQSSMENRQDLFAYCLLSSGPSFMLISTISTALKPPSSVPVVDCESRPDPA